MTSDLTFFTNEADATLVDRFTTTLRDVQYFDVLVGYFRTSGFRLLADALKSVEYIRILVGLNVDRNTWQIIEGRQQLSIDTAAETQALFADAVVAEMEAAPDTYSVEAGVRAFIDFLETGKLEIKAHPSQSIHAKVYIQRFPTDDRDFGRVITGSSNFSHSGLLGNYEFNVELKNRADVEFALAKFEELWAEAVDVNEQYVETIRRRTWLNDDIQPYHLYLKLLYEYFLEEINADDDIDLYLPEGFLSLEYQRQAVIAAQRVLDAYGGVFLADVVGLGKTYISALLAQQLTGRKLVICPPVLVDYWRETFRDFGVRSFDVESMGKLDHILGSDFQRYDYIFIDEAHRFRNERTQGYEKLAQISAGKKIILVSATPFNNTIADLFSQLKLFQPPRNSIIPGVRNLEAFFEERMRRIRVHDRSEPDYLPVVQQVAAEVRDRILTHVMVRRTRTQIERFYAEDIGRQGLSFPAVADPQRLVYRFDPYVSTIFAETIDRLQHFHYARYTPLLYLRDGVSGQLQQGQRNVGAFMRMMLVKRLESSFYAFRRTLERFIASYERFIAMVEDGTVYIGDVNILDLLDQDDDERLLQMVAEGEVDAYSSSDFVPGFADDLIDDLAILQEIYGLWYEIHDDPKRDRLISALQDDPILSREKVLIFTESAETAVYLYGELNAEFPGTVMAYSSSGGMTGTSEQGLGSPAARELILSNFDPRADRQSEQIRLLITTDVLAEGMNLHRSRAVVNYDLPWNPTRVLQRVGRVNRVGTEHSLIYIYNFFPTDQSDEQLGLEANITAKIQAFHNLLGEDARYLTEEEEIGDHDLSGHRLYERLNQRETYVADDEDERSELEYLLLLRTIRDEQPDLFEQVKRMPKKARAGWTSAGAASGPQTLTFFRQGRIKKFFLTGSDSGQEQTFFEAIDLVACEENTPRSTIAPLFYDHLLANKQAFSAALAHDADDTNVGRSSYEKQLRRYLNATQVRTYKGFTDSDEDFLQQVRRALEDGRLPQQTLRRAWEAIRNSRGAARDPRVALRQLRNSIPSTLLFVQAPISSEVDQPQEIILSAYLTSQSGDLA